MGVSSVGSIMKKVAIVLVAMMFSTVVVAAGKVVVFDLQTAIMSTDTAKKRLQALDANKDFAAMKTNFESLRADLTRMEKDAKINGMTWTPAQQADYRKKVEYKNADLQLVGEKIKAERNEVMNGLMQEMAPKAQEILESLVKSGDVDLVLNARMAFWAADGYNLTPEVTKRLNQAK